MGLNRNRFTLNDGTAGQGVLRPMDAAVGHAAYGMKPVLPNMGEITFLIWLVAHREVDTSPKIRLVFDILAQVLTKRETI